MPTTRAPRRANQEEKYAVPQPSSMTSEPATSGSTFSSESGTPQTPQLGSGSAHDRRPISAYSIAFTSQSARFKRT